MFDLLRQIKEDFPEEETFELRWASFSSFSRLRARTYVREGEDFVGGGGSPLKLGAGKTKEESRGGRGLHCVRRAPNCQARQSVLDLALEDAEALRAFEQPSGLVCAETDSGSALLERAIWSLRLVQKAGVCNLVLPSSPARLSRAEGAERFRGAWAERLRIRTPMLQGPPG